MVMVVRLLVAAFLATADLFGVAALLTHGFTESLYYLIKNTFDFHESVLDLLVFSMIRFAVLFGAVTGFALARDKSVALDKLMRLRYPLYILVVLMADFSLVKLLAIADKHDAPWYEMPWETAILGVNVLFSILLFVCWKYVICHVAGSASLVTDDGRSESQTNLLQEDESQNDDDDDEDDSKNPKKKKKKLAFHEGKTLVFRLFAYCRFEWQWYSAGFASLVIFSVAKIFIPYFTGNALSAIVTGEPHNVLMREIAIMAGLSAISTIFGGLRGGCSKHANNKINILIRNQLFSSIINQEIGFFDSSKTGDITSRLTADTQTMSDLVSLNMNVLLRNLIQLVGTIVFMFKLSWRLAVLNFICIPIMATVSELYGKYYEHLSKDCQTTLAKANEVADEVIGNIRTVRSFANENIECNRYAERLQITLKVRIKQCFAYTFYLWNNEFLSLTVLVSILWYGGHLVTANKMNGPSLISFLLYQMQLGDIFQQLGYVYTSLMEAAGASSKVFEYIDRKPTILNDGTEKQLSLQGSIQFDNVCFSYPSRPDSQILNNMSFKVSPGEVVALVGPSGGGKSSCFSLLQHFYEPNIGRILLDDVEVKTFDHKFYHRTVSMVSQEPVLFGRSVGENISYGLTDDEFLPEDIAEVSKLANAHDFIDEMKKKYETQTGEKGIQLSGGQKQRVAIARALIRKPKVLMLDEATSALDADSEFKVQEAIYQNLKGRTVILIAHRLSTVEKANRILVINKGQVVQQGTHSQLLVQDGLYRNLVQRQLIGSSSYSNNEFKIEPVSQTSSTIKPLPMENDDSNLAVSFKSISPIINSYSSGRLSGSQGSNA